MATASSKNILKFIQELERKLPEMVYQLFIYELTDFRDSYPNHMLTEVAEHLEDPGNLLRWREASPDLMMSVAAVRSAGRGNTSDTHRRV